jgi:hypothetical protein
MKNILQVLKERKDAWMGAQELWMLKQRGFDLENEETMKLILQSREDRKILQMIQTKRPYLQGRHRYIAKKLKVLSLPNQKDILKPFRVEPFSGDNGEKMCDIDLLPKDNRRHRSRRHKGRVRIARSEV